MLQHAKILALLTAGFILFTALPAFSLDVQQQAEFERIAGLKLAELTSESAALLEKKYPSEDWARQDFPAYVFTSDSVEIGYKIAVKEPALLGNPEIAVKGSDLSIPCYCFCDAMGHKNLLYCFWKEGKPGGEFDDHAAGCNICVGQAMLAFLWKNLGARDEEILKGMEKKFELLLQQRERKGSSH